MNLFPKTDCDTLRGWLDKRKASLERERRPHEGLWKTLAENYEPDLGRALDGDDSDVESNAAAPRDAKILNSTPRIELHRMAAAMKSGTANESRQWFRLRLARREDSQAENPAWKQWLDATTRVMASLLDQSNAYEAVGKLFLNTCLFGTGAAVVGGAHPQDTLEIRVLDMGAFWIGSTRGGRIDVLLRRVRMSAREVYEEFGEKRCPERAAAALEAGRDEERLTLWNLVCPNDAERFPDLDSSRPFASVWWAETRCACGGEDTGGIVDIRSYGYNPILCPRWETVEGLYGVGPGRMGMPEVLELYRLEKDGLKAIAQRVEPPMAAPESFRGAVETFPGGVTYYPEGMGRDRSIHPLFDAMPDISALDMKIQQVETRLRRVFYADLFNAILNVANHSATQMTARQVEEMSGEKISLLGPVLTNMNRGLFSPLTEGVWGVMVETDMVPEPPATMAGEEWEVEYISTLHMRQQEEARLGGVTRFMGVAQGVLSVSPASADKIDFDQILDEAGEALAVPGAVLRSDKDVAEIRAERARAQAEQQQAMAQAEMGRQAPGYADAAKKLSETPAGGASALEALLGAAGQTGGGLVG